MRGAIVLVGLVLSVCTGGAHAASLAHNGAIAYLSEDGNSGLGVYTVNPDGSARRQLTAPPPYGDGAAPSPDGKLVAFVRLPMLPDAITGGADAITEIWVAHADGTQPRRLVRHVAKFKDDSFVGSPTWAPDGRSLAYVETHGLAREIWTMAPDGSNRHLLVSSGEDPAWSPDGKHLAFSVGESLASSVVVANADGQGGHTVARGEMPAWSRDDRRLAYLQQSDGYDERLYVATANGRAKRLLAHDVEPGSGVSWTPDGWIVFWGNSDECFVCAIRPDGSGRHPLFGQTMYASNVSWSADGARMYFDRSRNRVWNDDTIYWLDTHTKDIHPLFPPPSGDDGAPAWRPEGHSVLYPATDGLHAVSIDDRGDTRIGPYTPDYQAWDKASWAPDGKRYAAGNVQGGIDIVDARTGKRRQIVRPTAENGVEAWSPSWSPDGKTIAYIRGTPGADHAASAAFGEGTLFLYDLTTRRSRRLGRLATGQIAWAPNAHSLVVADYSDGCGPACSSLSIVDLRTAKSRRIVVNAVEPTWAPDGTEIAFVRKATNGSEIWLVHADGTGQRQLTHDGERAYWPAWQPLP